MRAYIVDIGNEKTVPAPKGSGKKKVTIGTTYVVLIETGIVKDVKPQYQIQLLPPDRLIGLLAQQPSIEPINFMVKDGKVTNKYRDASLSRFNQKGFKVKPLVVLAEVHNKNGELLGYRYANHQGYQFLRKTKDFIASCDELSAQAYKTATGEIEDEFKPVQNMKYMNKDSSKNSTGTSYLSIYTETNPLPVEILVAKDNQYARPAKVVTEPKAKAHKKPSAKDALASIYTKEQLAEIKAASDNGVDVAVISNPKLSPEQMHIIWKTEASGHEGRKFADPAYPADYMQWLGLMMSCGVDTDPVLNPKYNAQQAAVILGGIIDGLDVNEYADPGYPVEEMQRIKQDLYEGLWGQGKIGVGTKYGPDNTGRTVSQPFRKDKE